MQRPPVAPVRAVPPPSQRAAIPPPAHPVQAARPPQPAAPPPQSCPPVQHVAPQGAAQMVPPQPQPRNKYGSMQPRFPTHATPTRKSSSTSTLFTDFSISHPEDLLRAVCTKLREYIEYGARMGHPVLPIIFSEDYHPLNVPGFPRRPDVPSIEEIYTFMNGIVSKLELNPICHIMCLAYVERLTDGGRRLTLHPSNWRRVVLSALLLAGKVFHDEAPWNVDMSDSFPWVALGDLNKMELQLLQLITFSVTLTPQQYGTYYFALRELSRDRLPEIPLDNAGLARLCEHTQRMSIALEQHYNSVDTGVRPSHTPAALN